MTKILLCNPPFYRLLGSHYNANSLGLAYTASVFQKMGYETSIYNADFNDSSYNDLKGIISNQNDYLEYFNDKNHKLWEEIVENILSFEPDIVGYTCYTANIPAVEIIAEKVKQKLKIHQIVGGPHFRIISKNLNKNGLLENPIKNINVAMTFPSEHLLVSEGDCCIDKYPFPNRKDFWGITEQQKKKVDVSYIITSRGCPFSCKFCANPVMWNNKVSFRSIESVIKELRDMRDNYGVKEAYILDDTFTLKSNRVKKLMKRMIDDNLNMKWKCNTRLDRLDEEICELMKKSGCVEAKVGVETGSEKMLKIIKKGETKDEMRKGVLLLKKSKIPITAYFLTGFPEETDEDLKETIDFAKELDIDRYSLSIFSPYFGSEIYNELEAKGELNDVPYQYFYHQLSRPLANKKLSDIMLEKYFDLSNLNKKGRKNV